MEESCASTGPSSMTTGVHRAMPPCGATSEAYLCGRKIEFKKRIQPVPKQVRKQMKIAIPGGRGPVVRIALLSKKFNFQQENYEAMPRNKE